MARGYAWKHRNDPPRGTTRRVTEKRELKSKPQFTFDELYITPFTKKRRYDEDGHGYYVNFGTRDLVADAEANKAIDGVIRVRVIG